MKTTAELLNVTDGNLQNFFSKKTQTVLYKCHKNLGILKFKLKHLPTDIKAAAIYKIRLERIKCQ